MAGTVPRRIGSSTHANSELPPIGDTASEKNGRARRFSGFSRFFGFGKNKSEENPEEKVRKSSGSSSRKSASSMLPDINKGSGSLVSSPLGSNHPPPPEFQDDALPEDIKIVCYDEYKEMLDASRKNKHSKVLQEFYESTFSSLSYIHSVFMKSREVRLEDNGIDLLYLQHVYEDLEKQKISVQKTVLKAIINCLLKDMKSIKSKYDLRAFYILLLNPQFNRTSTYVIFAHLLRQIGSLPDADHHYLVHWFKLLPKERFKSIVKRLNNFISVRLFPPKPEDLPPKNKCSWWIPSATKTLALIHAANSLTHPSKLKYAEFYNEALDHMDLMAEYYHWQNPEASGLGFSFCQYPFILSLMSKRNIMQRDSEQQMILMARRSLVQTVQQREVPDMGMLFLNIKVRRDNIVSDSLQQIAEKKQDLKKKLRVQFHGEQGIDMGGLTKEWFLLLLKKVFREEYGMFSFDRKSCCYWFNHACTDSIQEFNLVGVLMGLAVYNSIILDIRFPPICYKKLLSPAVVPYNNPRAIVGKTNVTFEDLWEVYPDLTRGLKDLLEYEGDVEDDFCLTFQVNMIEYGSVVPHQLVKGGDQIPVTNKNRQDYVNLYMNHLLNGSIYNQFAAFYHGFHSVCASNALIMLRPEEVETLVCGSPDLDLSILEKVTEYDGYSRDEPTIKFFWEIVKSYNIPMQKKLLMFTTGTDRIPVGGMSEMTFKITKMNISTSMLPMSHTCFNQLVLPPYRNKKQLKQKLTVAISNSEGFGLE